MGFESPKTMQDFQQAVIAHGDKPVFCKFSADFCGPCQLIAADLEKLSEEFSDKMGFIYVDVEALEDVAQAFSVENLPTFIILKNLNPVGSEYGTKIDKVRELVEKVL